MTNGNVVPFFALLCFALLFLILTIIAIRFRIIPNMLKPTVLKSPPRGVGGDINPRTLIYYLLCESHEVTAFFALDVSDLVMVFVVIWLLLCSALP